MRAVVYGPHSLKLLASAMRTILIYEERAVRDVP